jgi:hypothetical protein
VWCGRLRVAALGTLGLRLSCVLRCLQDMATRSLIDPVHDNQCISNDSKGDNYYL